jgi:hypothetical protein
MNINLEYSIEDHCTLNFFYLLYVCSRILIGFLGYAEESKGITLNYPSCWI